jgi:hypothetical protein
MNAISYWYTQYPTFGKAEMYATDSQKYKRFIPEQLKFKTFKSNRISKY